MIDEAKSYYDLNTTRSNKIQKEEKKEEKNQVLLDIFSEEDEKNISIPTMGKLCLLIPT